MLKESKNISDYLDIGFLQMLQDNCSKALGLAFVMVDYRGCPVTHYSGFTPYCRMGRKNREFFEMCKQCDAHGGLQAVITGRPYIYRCHAGLVDFALPLICDGTYVGSLMGGQIRLSPEEEGALECILPVKTDWRGDKALAEAYDEMQTVSYEKVKSAVTLLRDLILLMMQNGGQTGRTLEKETLQISAEAAGQAVEEIPMEQETMQKPPEAAGAAVDEVSIVQEVQEGQEVQVPDRAFSPRMIFSFQKREIANIRQQGRLRYFFFVMNIISQLAIREQASKTEAVAYDFADIMRYITESDHEISTLGEELSYIGALLRIQKAWAGDALSYSMSVPKQYLGANCPYMVLEPLVGMAVSGCEAGKLREIEIHAEEEKGDVIIQVVSNNEEMNLDEMDAQPGGSSQDDAFTLHDSDRSLKRIFGRRCGISIVPRKDGHSGQMVCFRLPLKKEG